MKRKKGEKNGIGRSPFGRICFYPFRRVNLKIRSEKL